MKDNNQALVQQATVSMGFMQGALTRQNAKGGRLGRTLGFIGSAPAGDVKKALAATGLKGKNLKARVAEVLRGEAPMAWAIHDAHLSVARSMGYVPVHTKSNKNEDVLTSRYEKCPPTAEEVARTCAAALPAAELAKMAMDRMDSNALLELIAQMEAEKKEKAEKAGATKASEADKAGALTV